MNAQLGAGLFFGEISLDLLESNHYEFVPPKSGMCCEASTGGTSPKKSPGWVV